jgi:hypothetical protein
MGAKKTVYDSTLLADKIYDLCHCSAELSREYTSDSEAQPFPSNSKNRHNIFY